MNASLTKRLFLSSFAISLFCVSCTSPEHEYAKGVKKSYRNLVPFYPPEGGAAVDKAKLSRNRPGWISAGPGSIHAVERTGWLSTSKIARGAAQDNAPRLFGLTETAYLRAITDDDNVQDAPTFVISLTDAASANLNLTANLSDIVAAWTKIGVDASASSNGEFTMTLTNPRYIVWPGPNDISSFSSLVTDKNRVGWTARIGLKQGKMQVAQRTLIADGFTLTYGRSRASQAGIGSMHSVASSPVAATATTPSANTTGTTGALTAGAGASGTPATAPTGTPTTAPTGTPLPRADVQALKDTFDGRGLVIKSATTSNITLSSTKPIFVGYEPLPLASNILDQIRTER
jgi:hypothetical protein